MKLLRYKFYNAYCEIVCFISGNSHVVYNIIDSKFVKYYKQV